MFVDSHAHLDSETFQEDLLPVLDRAADSGVSQILTIGCVGEEGKSPAQILGFAKPHPQLLAALGVHPHDARLYTPELGRQILDRMTHPRVLGWGEIGLDFHYDNSPREPQRRAFRDQLRLAQQARKPVIIHTRNAEEETIEILREELGESGKGVGVIHCFTADQVVAERFLALGFYLSFGGILSFPKSDELRETARRVPRDRILIETDAPYLAPVPHRGRRNEPAYVVRVAEVLAQVLGEDLGTIADLTRSNFHRLFESASCL